MKTFKRSSQSRDLLEDGRVILAHGEVTGHCHEVVSADPLETGAICPAQYFEEPDGRRVLLCDRPCVLRHEEHGLIALDPANPQPARQGDVYLLPIGPGAWEVIRQNEHTPAEIVRVVD